MPVLLAALLVAALLAVVALPVAPVALLPEALSSCNKAFMKPCRACAVLALLLEGVLAALPVAAVVPNRLDIAFGPIRVLIELIVGLLQKVTGGKHLPCGGLVAATACHIAHRTASWTACAKALSDPRRLGCNRDASCRQSGHAFCSFAAAFS